MTYALGTKYQSIMDDIKNVPGPGDYETIPVMGKYKNNSQYGSTNKLSKSKSTFSCYLYFQKFSTFSFISSNL